MNKRKGVKAWGEMLRYMARDPQKWFAENHLRSISEATNFVRKSRQGKLRKQREGRKVAVEFLRGVGCDLLRMAQLRYLEGIRPLRESYAS